MDEFLRLPFNVVRIANCPKCGAANRQQCWGTANLRDYHTERLDQARNIAKQLLAKVRAAQGT